MKRLTIMIGRGLEDMLECAAENEGLSKSEMVRTALTVYLVDRMAKRAGYDPGFKEKTRRGQM